MWKKLSFKMKLLFSVLPIVIIGMLVLSVTAIYQFRQTIRTEVINDKAVETKTMSENVNAWLEGKLLEVRNSTNTPTAKAIETDIASVDKFNSDRIKAFEKEYPGEYDNASATLFNNDGKSRAQYANGNFVNGDVAEKPWYKTLMSGAPFVISNPVISKGTGKALVVIGAPIKNEQNKSIGTMISGVNLSYIQDKIKAFKFGEKGYSLLIGQDGTFIVNPDEDLVMKAKIADVEDSNIKELGNKMLQSDTGTYTFNQGTEKYIVFYNKVPLSGWSLASVVSEDELLASSNKLMTTLLLITVVIVILIAGIIILVAKRITAPLRRLSEFSEEIAAGNLTVQLELKSNDEIGKVGRSLNNTTSKLKEMIGAISDSANEVSNLSSSLIVATEESLRGTDEVAKSMQEIASGAVAQAESAGRASTATEELVDKISEVTAKYGHMTEMVEDSKKVSGSGAKGVKEAIESIQIIASTNKANVEEARELLDKSKEIGQIVFVIKDIAEQTNLLALNAAIEAARAGEQGKGFAVVAEEVRILAEESSEASNRIAALINGIQTQIQSIAEQMDSGTSNVVHGVEVATLVGENFGQIENTFNKISSIVEEVSQATKEMSNKANTTSDVINNVAAVTEENSAATEEVTAANQEQTAYIHQIGETANRLDQLVETLKDTVNKFKI
ncbi:methyl-accepting chemotaxis protein [Clostridium saccharoperbutylacetonicum]